MTKSHWVQAEVTIGVDQICIDYGSRNSITECPIALACAAAGISSARVYTTHLDAKGIPYAALPLAARKALRDYDMRRAPMKPFSFSVTYSTPIRTDRT